MENNNKKDESSSKMDSNPNPDNNNDNNNNSENPNPNNSENPNPSSRRPFTNLSQVDADLALARTLQDQERAYMMLRMNNNGGDVNDDDGSDDRESWETVSYVNDDEFDHHNSEQEEQEEEEVDEDEEDAFDIHAHLGSAGGGGAVVELDPASFPNDEAYARALQDAEDQEMAARLLALTGIHDMVTDNDQDEDDDDDDDVDDDHHHRQDTWDDVDPDELSYEELLALGEVVGTESRGLSADSIASLRSMTYKIQNTQNGSSETCVICRLDYDDGDNLILLSCKHSYHSDCITNWLQINKVCPVCSTEVSTSGAAS